MTTAEAIENKASIADRIRARAPIYWRYILEKPSWVLMFLFARTLPGRRAERWMKNARYRQPLPAPGSIFGDKDPNEAVNALIENGVVEGFVLPNETVRAVRDFADTTPCFSRDRQDRGFLPRDIDAMNRTRSRDILAGHYFEAVEQSPAINRIRRDPLILNIAAAYIGQKPVHIRTRLWWSFPATRVTDADLHAAAQEKFHFDMNGWRTLKFFFYITPVDDRSGAHRCILGSHRRRSIRQQLSMTVGRDTMELETYYGKDQFLTITGEAGTGFAEDPFLFHTGSLCRNEPRLILELEYGPAEVGPSYKYGRLG